MNTKYIVGGILLVVVAIAVGVMLAIGGGDAQENSSQAGSGKSNQTVNNQVKPTAEQMSDKKGIKRFTLTTVGGSGVKGDGSITLKDKLTSAAVRLTEAPSLPSGSQYEVYVSLKGGGDPVFAGNLQSFDSPNAKFLWGGAGQVSWFEAVKFIVTKRSASQAKPGTVVAEGSLPSKSEPIQ